jgi:hypothetical protein
MRETLQGNAILRYAICTRVFPKMARILPLSRISLKLGVL